jgi:phosphonate transport system substrate-binding protein
MCLKFSHIRKTFLIFLLLFAAMLVFVYGCGNENKAAIIDFSKTVVAERPGEKILEQPLLRVAVAAMICLKETFVYYRQFLDYIGNNLNREVQLIQRKTYSEINELLGQGLIDLAFICSGPYVTGKEKHGFEAIAVPQIRGKQYYQSYLIVNKESSINKLEDLKGRIFAFTDPESNTGKLAPTYWLAQMKEHPETFFQKTIYTYSHDNSILAVARSLVDGAAVDGLIWEYYNHENNLFTSKTRIIMKSEPYGVPPLVVSRNISSDLKEHIKRLFLSMHLETTGQEILNELMIERFVVPRDKLYDPIRRMTLEMASIERSGNVTSQP